MPSQRDLQSTLAVHKPSAVFVAASWSALLPGALACPIGLFNAQMPLDEKGYCLSVLLFGLLAAVSLQKSARDRLESIAVSGLYCGLCRFALLGALSLLVIGLWNAWLLLSQKGFYDMADALALFGAMAVQKNTRELMAAGRGALPPLPPHD